MYIYYCWVTTILPSYQDGIIAGLAKKGYMVGPAAKDGKIVSTKEDAPAALITLSVYKAEETSAAKIYDDLIKVLQEMKVLNYSVIVALCNEATWSGPNIRLPKEEKAQPPPLPSGAKKNMN